MKGVRSLAYTQDILDSIRERVSFSEIVSEYVQLKRSGRNFVGLCPFHQEKTPSFSVREEEASYYCFGCGKKGSVFNFVMEMRGFTFPEAVRFLARQAGVALPEEKAGSDAESQERAQHQRLLREVVQAVSEIYSAELKRSKAAAEYLRKRNVQPPTAERFCLGFAPNSWDFLLPKLCEQMNSGSSSRTESDLRSALLELGLLKQKQGKQGQAEGSAAGQSARCYDALRERIIFPITRSDGKPIAFGGRTFTEEANVPKYLNSSENLLYAKRKSFFGLSQALHALRRERHLYLVEGYLDVLSLHQIGIQEVVATCGTAVTADHALVLKRLVDSVTIVFDGDAAGRKAAAQCFPIFLNSGLDLDVVLLAGGHDPDSAAQAFSVAEVRELLEGNRVPIADVYLRSLLENESTGNAGELSAAARGRAARRYASVLALVKNPVEKEFLLRRGAEHLGVSMEAFDALAREESKKAASKSTFTAAPAAAISPPRPRAEATPKAEAAPRSARRQPQQRRPIDVLVRQLLVSVLCEPVLADTLVQLADVEASVRRLTSDHSLGERIFAFVRDYRQSGYKGISERVAETRSAGKSLAEAQTNAADIRAMVVAHGLEHFGIFEEAFRQAAVGGIAPLESVSKSSAALARLSQEVEMSDLRAREKEESDEASKLRLAQEKLQRKRELEKRRAAENMGQLKTGN
jgi:DNA primase